MIEKIGCVRQDHGTVMIFTLLTELQVAELYVEMKVLTKN